MEQMIEVVVNRKQEDFIQRKTWVIVHENC